MNASYWDRLKAPHQLYQFNINLISFCKSSTFIWEPTSNVQHKIPYVLIMRQHFVSLKMYVVIIR